MEIFITNITSFPVVIYTFLLIIVLCYWLLAMVGAVDIDLFDLDLDTDLEIDTDMDLEVSTEAMNGNSAEGLGTVTGFMLNWGLTGVPITVVISLLILISWLFCYFVVSIAFPFIPWDAVRYAVGAILLFICFALSIPVTALSIRPFKGFFVSHNAISKSSLIGRQCEVKTGRVTNDFGQAILEDGEAGLILDIRADESKNLKKGDAVILIEYNEKNGSYYVAKY